MVGGQDSLKKQVVTKSPKSLRSRETLGLGIYLCLESDSLGPVQCPMMNFRKLTCHGYLKIILFMWNYLFNVCSSTGWHTILLVFIIHIHTEFGSKLK